MAGNKEVNSNLQIKGKINLKDVPNNTPTGFLVWNSEIKDIAQRTSAQLLTDLNLITATNIAANYYTNTQVDTNIKTAVDDIQIGGRNLIAKVNLINGAVNGNNGQDHVFNYPTHLRFINKKYFGDSKTMVAGGIPIGSTLNVYFFNQGDYLSYQMLQNKVSVNIPPNATNFKIELYGGGENITPEYIHQHKIKLEFGNKATDWTPNPEDQITDWNTTDVNDFSFLKNKPTNLSQFSNDVGYLTSSALSPYAQTSWVNDNFDKYGSWNLQTNGSQRTSMPSGSILNLVAGSNVFIAYNAGGKVIITAGNTTYVQGDGISITGADNVITNTKPNIVQTLSGSGNTINLSNGGSHTIPAQAWASIIGKPATFPPDAHSHTFASITDKPTTIAGYGITDAISKSGSNVVSTYDWNITNGDGFIGFDSSGYPYMRWGAKSFHIYEDEPVCLLNTHFEVPDGYIAALQFVKSGGTGTQVLMADGSVREQSTIGGSNYTAGSNISIAGNAISVVNSPTFSGSVTAPAFYEGSLKSLKKNIKTFEKSGLELVGDLKIVTFDRKDESAKNKIGIIADDSPKEFLSEEKDSVDLYKTVFIQAKAIQELKSEVDELKEIVKQLLNK